MKNRIECANRNCRWTGTEEQLKKVRDTEFDSLEIYDNVCPRCEHKSYYNLVDCVQCDRVDHINELIKIIATHGRKFFSHGEVIANMEKDENGKIWFVDEYTRRRIYVAYRGDWAGFNNGGTMRALVQAFYQYIKTGKPVSIKALAEPDFYRDGGNMWGYDLDEAKKMRELAAKLPCVSVPEGVEL